MTDIKEINEQINKLNEERQKLLKAEEEKHLEELRSLEWAKGLECFYYEAFGLYSGTEFSLTFGSANPILKCTHLGAFSGVPLMGDSVHYYENVLLKRGDVGFKIVTENAHLFIEFVEKSQIVINPNRTLMERIKVMDVLRRRMNTTVGLA